MNLNPNSTLYIDGWLVTWSYVSTHHKLTRVRIIWFLLFEIKRVLVYDSTIFKLCYFIQNVYTDKKVNKEKC